MADTPAGWAEAEREVAAETEEERRAGVLAAAKARAAQVPHGAPYSASVCRCDEALIRGRAGRVPYCALRSPSVYHCNAVLIRGRRFL